MQLIQVCSMGAFPVSWRIGETAEFAAAVSLSIMLFVEGIWLKLMWQPVRMGHLSDVEYSEAVGAKDVSVSK